MAKREEIRAMRDAWRAYLDLALGFTEASRKQATKVARRLVGKGGATAEQVQGMAEDLVKTSLANRESLTRLVRFELDRALGRVGLATAEEVADLTSRVRDLEQRLRAAEAAATSTAGTDGSPLPAAAAKAASATVPSEAAKAAPRKASPASSPASGPASGRASGSASSPAPGSAPGSAPGAAKAAPAKKAAPAQSASAKAAPAKAAPAKKAVAKKAVAKQATGTPPAGDVR